MFKQSGHDCRDFPPVKQQGFCGRHCIQADRNGVLQAFRIDPELQRHIFDEVRCLAPGDRVTNHLSQKLAVLMLRYDSREQMAAITPRLHQLAQAVVA